ncbi:MAG: TetR/AcrR family transcriptional regulator [Bacteroidota bacterium]
MARLSKEDWLKEGFKILAEFAQNKLRILYLCERLKVTRGSFYHHFKSIDVYIAELMKAWEKENTLEFIRAASKGGSPQQRMALLNERVVAIDQSIEAAIRSWSFYNPQVKQHLEQVDQIRLTYLEGIFLEMGFEAEKALAKAKLEYAILVGLQQLYPNTIAYEMEQLYEVYMESQ